MDNWLFEKFHEKGLLSDSSYKNIRQPFHEKKISVFIELKLLLYTGILLLTTGISILIYKNIDTIGHQIILFTIALVCAGCFYWCFKKQNAIFFSKVGSPVIYFDYVLLLACLLLLTLIAYLQFEYKVFGNFRLETF